MSMNQWGPGQYPSQYPNQWQQYGPPGQPQYRPPQRQINRYKAGAIVCWIVTVWFTIQAIEALALLNGFWGPFIGTRETFALLYCIVLAVASGLGGWYLWRKGGGNPILPTGPFSSNPGGNPGPGMPPPGSFAGPSEPRPYSPEPGWKPDPWGGVGQWRYWNGQSWTPHFRVGR
jgi:hypothetical protein